MESRTEEAMVFVSHRMTGVHRIPAAWLDGYAPSGFRPATAAQIRLWYEERGLDLPLAPDAPASATVGAVLFNDPESPRLSGSSHI
jgi:hypothetical protein